MARHETDHGATGSQHSPVPLWTESFPLMNYKADCDVLRDLAWVIHVESDISSLFEEGPLLPFLQSRLSLL